MHLLNIFFLVLAFLFHDVLSYETAVVPITKDERTSLYKVGWDWKDEPNYLIDLHAPFTWEDCNVTRPSMFCLERYDCMLPLPCNDFSCIDARSYINPLCPSLNIMAKYGCHICAVTPFNPVSKSCKISQLASFRLYFALTDGRNPIMSYMPNLYFAFSCAPSSLKTSLPIGVKAVAAFSWSDLAFPRQRTDTPTTDKFALCLSSSSLASGVSFIGDGPFYFLPTPNIDIRNTLSYTPMIRKTSKSLGFYVTINKISIKETSITLPSLKTISAKFSTLIPYSTLRSDIYKAVVTSFSKATKSIPRVNAVQPFSLCLKASTKFHIPNIDHEMESGKSWTISSDNSVKNVGNGVACLAFIDGGLQVDDAIVIGTFQMENNFLFFDLGNQRLGLSSSLLARGTSCSSFNTTLLG